MRPTTTPCTATSRVAICQTPSGKYEYRGVRISDGAKLVVPASTSSDGGFVADSDGITYTVTSSSLVVSEANQVIRTESMDYFHRPKTPAAPPGTSADAGGPGRSEAVLLPGWPRFGPR